MSEALVDDLEVIEAMRRFGGSFVSALGEAASRADYENLQRLKEAWPEYWLSYSAKAINERRIRATEERV